MYTAAGTAKSLLTSTKVHFDPSFDLLLACDESAYGLGAVFSHKMADGSERPIAFASRVLSETEQRYSQIEKLVLACVFLYYTFRPIWLLKRLYIS